jgi:hypothetical protein
VRFSRSEKRQLRLPFLLRESRRKKCPAAAEQWAQIMDYFFFAAAADSLTCWV